MPDKASKALPLADTAVLVVDDEFLIGLEVESCLREAGAAVLGPYMTLSTATLAAKSENFDAAILDIRLGQDTTASIGELLIQRGIPFLLYSGGRSSDAELAGHVGMPFIAKPAPQGILVRSVLDLLAVESQRRRLKASEPRNSRNQKIS
jgi:DNA-binding NtrC family response regulator